MKKIIVFIMSVTILAAFTGCSDKSDEKTVTKTATTTTVETTLVETEDVSDIMSETTVNTSIDMEVGSTDGTVSSEIETSSETEISVDKSDMEAVLAAKNDAMWAIDMSRKIDEWENNVNLRMVYNLPEDATGIGGVNMFMHRLGDKFAVSIDVSGIMSSDMLYDGKDMYCIDKALGYYYKSSMSPEAGSAEMNAYLVSDSAADCFLGDGIEEVNGVAYIYEEYDIEGQKIKYYFDENAEVIYAGSDADGYYIYFDFIVEFADSKDESIFAIPDGLTEVTEDEYVEILLGSLES